MNSNSSLFLPLVLSSARALLFFSPPLQLAFISLMHSGAAAAAEVTIGQSLRLLPLKKLARAQPKHALKGQQRRQWQQQQQLQRLKWNSIDFPIEQ